MLAMWCWAEQNKLFGNTRLMKPDFQLHAQHLVPDAVLPLLHLLPHAEQNAKSVVKRATYLFSSCAFVL